MSEEACAWAQGETAGNRTAKFVLMRLAAYADVEGVGWIHVPTIAKQIECDDRTVQRALRVLERQGLIGKTGAFKYRLIPYYRLDIDGSARAAAVPAEGPANGDILSPLDAPPMVTSEASNGDTGVTPKKGNKPSEGSNEPPSGRVRAGEVDVRELAWDAYPVEGRKGPSSKRLWDAAWASEIANGASSLAILGAVRAYAGDRKAWGPSRAPKAAHAWLGEGRWEAFAPAAGTVVETLPAAAVGWTGPAEIRALLVALKDEAFARAWLDRCVWDGAAVVANLRFVAATLRDVFRGTEIEVLDPPASTGRAVG